MSEKEKETKSVKTMPKYTKRQFINSKKFTPAHKDLLHVLLKDEETYTNEQAEKLVEDFMKKEVK